MAATNRLQGTITRLVPERGFGFILGPENEDYFFHQSDIENCSLQQLAPGDPVSFDPTSTPKGLRANSITRLRK